MAKKAKHVTAVIKLQIPAGQATPAPPVGPALGTHGLNIGEFVSKFNDQTKDRQGTILPVVITVYSDRSFSFIMKKPPAAVLLKEAAGLAKGAADPLREKIGKISTDQLRQIAKTKMEDLNTKDIQAAMKIIAGTARSMGIEIQDA